MAAPRHSLRSWKASGRCGLVASGLALALGLTCCSGGRGGADGGPPTDDCHSPEAAEVHADCQLTLGAPKTGFIYPAGDQEWFHLALPSDLPVRPLLQVNAGMVNAPQSRIVLNVNVQASGAGASPDWADGGSALNSLGLGQDPRTNGLATPVVMSLPLSGVASDLYVLIDDSPYDDSGGRATDPQHPFSIVVSAATDPDAAGHTPSTATPIELTPDGPFADGGAGAGFADGGVLSTTGDTDYYSVVVPPMQRPILYVDLAAPALSPPAQAQLMFTVFSQLDGGAPIASATAFSSNGAQEVSTASLLPGPGTYFVEVEGYRPFAGAPPPPGDPRLAYTLSVILIEDLDVNEPNDTAATATPIPGSGRTLALGEPVTVVGRIAYVPDPDWYRISIPESAGANTLLRYQVSFVADEPNDARYPAIDYAAAQGPTVNDRVLSLTTQNLPAPLCESLCPADPDVNVDYCSRTPPQCAYSLRDEDPVSYPGLENFQGVIPVPQHSGTTDYLVLMEVPDAASDDRAYQIAFTWEPESPNEAAHYQDTYGQAIALTMPLTPTYSEQPPAAPAAVGQLSYGELERSGPTEVAMNAAPLLPWSPADYDAMEDTDLWVYRLPTYPPLVDDDGGLADAGAPDLAWSLAWSIPPAPSQGTGERPEDLTLTLYLCDPASNPTCDPGGTWWVDTQGYSAGTAGTWFGGSATPYDFDPDAGTFAASPSQCLCLESRFVQGGTIYLAVSGVDRTSYDDSTYRVAMAVSPYPQANPNFDGGLCPLPCQACEGPDTPCSTVVGIAQQTP